MNIENSSTDPVVVEADSPLKDRVFRGLLEGSITMGVVGLALETETEAKYAAVFSLATCVALAVASIKRLRDVRPNFAVPTIECKPASYDEVDSQVIGKYLAHIIDTCPSTDYAHLPREMALRFSEGKMNPVELGRLNIKAQTYIGTLDS